MGIFSINSKSTLDEQKKVSILLSHLIRISPERFLDRLSPQIPDLFRTALLGLVLFILCLVEFLDAVFTLAVRQSLDAHAEPKGIPIVRATAQLAVSVDIVELAA